jgi:hypothetical protein
MGLWSRGRAVQWDATPGDHIFFWNFFRISRYTHMCALGVPSNLFSVCVHVVWVWSVWVVCVPVVPIKKVSSQCNFSVFYMEFWRFVGPRTICMDIKTNKLLIEHFLDFCNQWSHLGLDLALPMPSLCPLTYSVLSVMCKNSNLFPSTIAVLWLYSINYN